MAGPPGSTAPTVPGSRRRSDTGDAADTAEGALQQVVDALAARLGRSVAIDDPALRLVAASAHFGDEDGVRVQSLLRREIHRDNRQFVLSQGIARWATPGRLAANLDFDAKARLCLPLRHRDVLLGYLWLIDPEESLTAQEMAQVQAAGRTAAAVLFRRRVRSDDVGRRQQALLGQVLSAEPGTARDAWQYVQDHRLLTSPGCVAVLVVAAPPRGPAPPAHTDRAPDDRVPDDRVPDDRGPYDRAPEDRAPDEGAPDEGAPAGHDADDGEVAWVAAVAATRDLAAGTTLVGVHDRRTVLLVSAPADSVVAVAAAVARRAAHGVDRRPAAAGCLVGVGPVRGGLDGVRASYEQACVALRVGRLLPHLGPVVDGQRAGVYPWLLTMLPPGPAAVGYPDCVARLLHGDPSGKLARTVEAYLDEAGDAQRAAARLHVHRTTLYYRLGRVADVSGVDLAVGDSRLALHMGLRLARLTGALRDEQPPLPGGGRVS